MKRRLAFLWFAVLGACVMQDGDPGPAVAVTRTIVELRPGTDPVVRVVPVSAEERQRDLVERAALAKSGGNTTLSWHVGGDNSCASSSMWIFDGANETGNEICFYGAWDLVHPYNDTLALASYCRWSLCAPNCTCAGTWKNHVGSFEAGTSAGCFKGEGDGGLPGCTRDFTAWELSNAAVPNAAYLKLTP